MSSGLSLSNLSYSSSPNVDRTSPQNHSIPFSISAILSDEVGQKRSPTASSSFSTPNNSRASTHQQGGGQSYWNISPSSSRHLQLDTPKRPQARENLNLSQRKPHISLSDAANMFSSYETSTVQGMCLCELIPCDSCGLNVCNLVSDISTKHMVDSLFVLPFNSV